MSGFSQNLMLQVFTGNYVYDNNSTKINVNPFDSFQKALLHPGYDLVTNVIILESEGCVKYLGKKN